MDEATKLLLEQIIANQAEHSRKIDDCLEKISKVGERAARLEGRAGALGTVAGGIAGAITSFLFSLLGGHRA